MNIRQFILDRISDDERQPAYLQPHREDCNYPGDMPGYCDCGLNAARCDALRRIVQWHDNWPVMVETRPTFEWKTWNGDDVVAKVTQQMNWLTQAEYIKRFGTEPPTAPILAMIAGMWSSHPDFDQDWVRL